MALISVHYIECIILTVVYWSYSYNRIYSVLDIIKPNNLAHTRGLNHCVSLKHQSYSSTTCTMMENRKLINNGQVYARTGSRNKSRVGENWNSA